MEKPRPLGRKYSKLVFLLNLMLYSLYYKGYQLFSTNRVIISRPDNNILAQKNRLT